MSVACTARRRRKQYAKGLRGLEQIYGKKAAPVYRKVSAVRSAKTLARIRALAAKGIKV